MINYKFKSQKFFVLVFALVITGTLGFTLLLNKNQEYTGKVLSVSYASYPSYPVCSSYTYSNWTNCSNGYQTRTVTASYPVTCTAVDILPVTSKPCFCTSFTYSDWTYCLTGQQSREVTSVTPSGCMLGAVQPDLFKTCDPDCVDYSYTSWGKCINGIQKRSVVASYPVNCVPTTTKPVTQLDCTSTSSCANIQISNWSICQNGIQTRSIISKTPKDCVTGTIITQRVCDVVSSPIQAVTTSGVSFMTVFIALAVTALVGSAVGIGIFVYQGREKSRNTKIEAPSKPENTN